MRKVKRIGGHAYTSARGTDKEGLSEHADTSARGGDQEEPDGTRGHLSTRWEWKVSDGTRGHLSSRWEVVGPERNTRKPQLEVRTKMYSYKDRRGRRPVSRIITEEGAMNTEHLGS